MPRKPGARANRRYNKRLSTEKRWEIIHTYKHLQSIKATANHLGFNESTAALWVKRFTESGDVKPSLHTGRKRFVSDEAASAALALLSSDARPSATQVAHERK